MLYPKTQEVLDVTPLVSIVCITYNHERYIRDAIESFLIQEVTFPIEILIHDDASTDNTANIVRRYEEKYPSIIRAIYQKENQVSKGKKILPMLYGIASGKYIALCEGDDYWIDPHKLQKQVAYMEQNPGCSLCFHDAILVDVDKTYLGPFRGTYTRQEGMKRLSELVFTPTASKLFRTSCVKELPDWFFDAPYGDFSVVLVCSKYGYVYYHDECMSAYRTNVPGSATWRAARSERRDPRAGLPKALRRLAELENYNRWSNYINDDVIRQMILEQELRILGITKDYQKVKDKKYKELFRKMGIWGRVKFWFRWFAPPRLYSVLCDLKNMLMASWYRTRSKGRGSR